MHQRAKCPFPDPRNPFFSCHGVYPYQTQCFLLTPKLLPDLDYGDDITILQIMNGAITTGGGGNGPGGSAALSWDIRSLLGSNAMALAARG